MSILEVSGVSVSFDGFRAINNLSFAIGAQELRAGQGLQPAQVDRREPGRTIRHSASPGRPAAA